MVVKSKRKGSNPLWLNDHAFRTRFTYLQQVLFIKFLEFYKKGGANKKGGHMYQEGDLALQAECGEFDSHCLHH